MKYQKTIPTECPALPTDLDSYLAAWQTNKFVILIGPAPLFWPPRVYPKALLRAFEREFNENLIQWIEISAKGTQ